MKTEQTEAIVLKIGRRYERGSVITAFGEQTGVGSFFGYGGKRSADRKQPAYYPSMLVQLTYYPGRNDSIPKIKEAASLYFHTDLIRDIWKNAHMNIIFEMLIIFLHGVTTDYDMIYRMTVKWLKLMSEFSLAYDLVNGYLIKLCYFLGFGIQLDRCICCDETLADFAGTVYLKTDEGGFLCSLCQADPVPESHVTFSHEEFAYLRELLRQPLDETVAGTALSPRSRKRLRNILLHYLRYNAGKPLKTLPFLLEIDR